MIVEGLDSEFVIDEEMIEEPEEEIRTQIEEFLSAERNSFSLNFSFPDGSLGYVLREVNKISYGETNTYSEIANKSNTSAIAGGYCGRNPLPVIIPCHRVVGKNNLGGYKSGKETKRKLLKLENSLPEY